MKPMGFLCKTKIAFKKRCLLKKNFLKQKIFLACPIQSSPVQSRMFSPEDPPEIQKTEEMKHESNITFEGSIFFICFILFWAKKWKNPYKNQ